VIGAGGIGVDVSTALTYEAETLEEWRAHWGVADPAEHRGGLAEPTPRVPARQVTLLQRKTTPIGIGLGKTSGWAHRARLKQEGVRQISGVTYDAIETGPGGGLVLHYTVDAQPQTLPVDTIVVCAGQESVRELWVEGAGWHLIGGADVAAELDAKRAIKQGTEVAAAL
jgi:2,4-dienoyl-CoA reductase (NADPH2)